MKNRPDGTQLDLAIFILKTDVAQLPQWAENHNQTITLWRGDLAQADGSKKGRVLQWETSLYKHTLGVLGFSMAALQFHNWEAVGKRGWFVFCRRAEGWDDVFALILPLLKCLIAELKRNQTNMGGGWWWSWWRWYLEMWKSASVSYYTIPPFPHLAGIQSAALSGTGVRRRCVGRSKHFPGLPFFPTACGFWQYVVSLSQHWNLYLKKKRKNKIISTQIPSEYLKRSCWEIEEAIYLETSKESYII